MVGAHGKSSTIIGGDESHHVALALGRSDAGSNRSTRCSGTNANRSRAEAVERMERSLPVVVVNALNSRAQLILLHFLTPSSSHRSHCNSADRAGSQKTLYGIMTTGGTSDPIRIVTSHNRHVTTTLPDLVALLTIPTPSEHIFASWQVSWDEHTVHDLESRLGTTRAVFHALAHRRWHAELHARRSKAYASLVHVVAWDGAAGPHGALRRGAFRDVCPVEPDLLATVCWSARPAKTLFTDELEWNLAECLFV